jgi:hypothetical protein
MYQGYYQWMLDGSLEAFCETWPRAGMMQNGTAYQRRPLVPRTGEIGSGLWLTPTVTERWSDDEIVITRNGTPRRRYKNGRTSSLGLTAQVILKMMPTPTEHGNYNRKGASPTSGDGLATAVKRWPTPRVFMHKDSTIDRGKGNLGEVVGGKLNPTWVEWLQGLPLGWTEV